MFYVESKLSRWATQAVPYQSQAAAEEMARKASIKEPGVIEIVWDCSKDPVGVEVSRFVRGVRSTQA
jgi:hypothetical protein